MGCRHNTNFAYKQVSSVPVYKACFIPNNDLESMFCTNDDREIDFWNREMYLEYTHEKWRGTT